MRYQRCGWYKNSVEAYVNNPELPHVPGASCFPFWETEKHFTEVPRVTCSSDGTFYRRKSSQSKKIFFSDLLVVYGATKAPLSCIVMQAQIRALGLHSDALNGTIPSWRGLLTALTWLAFFAWTGTIPLSVGRIVVLQRIVRTTTTTT